MEFQDIGTYTIEGAAALLLAVAAYKLYKLRIASESDCCSHAFRVKTSNRGNSNNDLELVTIDS
tara:strand:+ start:523 stop:714 length:192 start_codon:yes stop_codon:yes gene_type:complete